MTSEPISNADVEAAIICGLEELRGIVGTPEFQAVVGELYSLPVELRPEFVDLALLDKEALTARGVNVPENVFIQRSFFADDRPTLFCVSKYIISESRWKKVTITFDNPEPGTFTDQMQSLGIGKELAFSNTRPSVPASAA